MNRKLNLVIIVLIFALPILFYMATRSYKQNSSSIDAEAANKPKVLHFSQQMCSECRKLEGVMKPVEEEYKGKVNFVDIDVAQDTPQNAALMQKYSVRVVPTLVFIDKNGKVINRTEGSMSKEELERNLDSICNE